LQGEGLPRNFAGGLHSNTWKLWRWREVPTGTCPECAADVHIDTDTDKGDAVACEECGTGLEVVGLDPVELDIIDEDDDVGDEDEDY